MTLTAVPAVGYTFSYWGGDHIGTSNPATVVIDDDKSVYAHFTALDTYTLSIDIVGEGSVTRDPAGSPSTTVNR